MPIERPFPHDCPFGRESAVLRWVCSSCHDLVFTYEETGKHVGEHPDGATLEVQLYCPACGSAMTPPLVYRNYIEGRRRFIAKELSKEAHETQ